MEDVTGIPNVEGLDSFVRANTEQPDRQERPRDEKGQFTQPEGKAEELKRLKSFKNPDGSYNLENVDKSYGEIQGLATKTAQENKTLQDQLNQLQEQMRLMQMSIPQQVPQTPQPQDFDQQFINNPEKAIEGKVERKVLEAVRTMTVQEVLSKEQLKNPDEFPVRYNYAMRARQMYPNLVNSSSGVEMLFQLGDKMRESDDRRAAERYTKLVFGPDADLDKFKELVRKDQQTDPHANKNLAYMPDSSGAFRTGPPTGTNSQSHDAAINDAVQKGDPDAVLKNIFARKLST